MRKRPEELRSHRWFGVDDLRAFGHRSRLAQMGFSDADWAGKPVIGILNTWSDLSPCHAHFRVRAEEIKRGVWQAGGFPVEIPVLPVTEQYMKPTSMLYRNLLALETEELIRSQPVDGVVLMGGCDKTGPGLIMGALSAGLPAIFFPAGAQLRGHWRGKTLGSGSDAWKYHAELRAGNITQAQWKDMEGGMNRSFGVCMTAGTAATMMLAAEAMGFSLPASAGIPSADAGHPRLATDSGRRIVEMVWEDWTPAAMLTQASVDNAVTATMAFGGSTNAIPHLIAMARRAGLALDLDRFDAISRSVPLVANLRPNNGSYLMEDFFYAGGSRAFLARIAPYLDLDARTVTGRTLGEDIAGAEVFNPDVIRPLEDPIQAEGGLAVLRGSLAPRGAVIKHSAADPRLLQHTGPAIVFESYDDMNARLDDPELDVTPDSVLVLKGAGPLGGPGMPEWGMLPIPKKMLQAGVRDMVRISDARMSGTSYGTCILHVAPESHVGGPLALVRDGDLIRLDTEGRRLDLLVEADELERRASAWAPPPRRYARGYTALFLDRVGQADTGVDFDFLEHGPPTPEPEIH
ncbi:L-arabinonate dehydratase [Methylobacterium sp. NEAU 140]|uniref:L-arabinonate dehydratase n=1 Tax=Methylobacterium sp. NEAU 140 TaxID=3064945 RepID=UPI0027355F19|nr:L-arabinonate dehydratase [Methylobacterium sp. NEAU 140]MDP4024344.1 L-arabinonate dehydratase [Methylobacterium sp. NEAU 140]